MSGPMSFLGGGNMSMVGGYVLGMGSGWVFLGGGGIPRTWDTMGYSQQADGTHPTCFLVSTHVHNKT